MAIGSNTLVLLVIAFLSALLIEPDINLIESVIDYIKKV